MHHSFTARLCLVESRSLTKGNLTQSLRWCGTQRIFNGMRAQAREHVKNLPR